MKKLLSIMLVLVMLMSITTMGAAAWGETTYTCGEYGYMLADDGTAIITDYTGSDLDIVVPATLDGHVVSEIGIGQSGDDAFQSTDILSVDLSNTSVKRINKCAFYYCTNLTTVTLSDTVEMIDNCAFQMCKSLTKIDTANVKIIGEYAFNDCEKLSDVKLGDSLNVIGQGAFQGCDSLSKVVVPASVATISEYAFLSDKTTDVYILSKDCSIYDGQVFGYQTTLYSYKGSTTQEYANNNDKNFVAIGIVGDVDLDGEVSVMDATEIQMVMAQVREWKIDLCVELADVDGDGESSVMDATEIQMIMAGLR